MRRYLLLASHTTDWQGRPPMVTEGLLFDSPKFEPMMVTMVPPPALPCPGSMAMTVGASYKNCEFAFLTLVLPSTSTRMALCAPTPSGVSQSTEVADTHTTCGHGAPPSEMEGCTLLLPPPKFRPLIVMMVPPPVGPLAGLTSSTIGKFGCAAALPRHAAATANSAAQRPARARANMPRR